MTADAAYCKPVNYHSSQRNISLDWIGGLLIIKTIIAHGPTYYPVAWLSDFQLILNEILFMAMPWFFFKAGMFCKDKPLHSAIGSSARRLLYPWVVFGIMGIGVTFLPHFRQPQVLLTILSDGLHYALTDLALPGNPAVWFLASMFACRVIFTALYKIQTHPGYMGICIGAVAALMFKAFLPAEWQATHIFPVIFMSLFFFSAGAVLKERQYTRLWFICSCVILVGLTTLDSSLLDMRTNGANMHSLLSYAIWCLRAVCGIVVIDYLCSHFSHNHLKRSLLTYVGRNSMGFYAMHMPLMYLFKIAMYQFPTVSEVQASIILLVFLAILLSRYLRWTGFYAATGQKHWDSSVTKSA